MLLLDTKSVWKRLISRIIPLMYLRHGLLAQLWFLLFLLSLNILRLLLLFFSLVYASSLSLRDLVNVLVISLVLLGLFLSGLALLLSTTLSRPFHIWRMLDVFCLFLNLQYSVIIIVISQSLLNDLLVFQLRFLAQ